MAIGLAACASEPDATKPSPADAGKGSAGSTSSTQAGSGGKAGAESNPAAQVEAAQLGSAGLGVSDLAKATAFYRDILGMAVEKQLERDDRAETVLHFADQAKGSSVTLLHYTDGSEHNYANASAKVVFYVPDVNELVTKERAAGFEIILEPVAFGGATVSQALDPDGYTVEIIEQAGIKPYLGALGIGVSDLSAAIEFYSTLDMKPTEKYDIRTLHEQVMVHNSGKGSGLVLMHWDDTTHVYQDNPVKQVRLVPDAAAFLADIEKAGGTVLKEPAHSTYYDNALLGAAHDPDGYLLEVVQ
jgi:catechol 2,3-dioxygenase-like lactoylglutathione lyase family enzyme